MQISLKTKQYLETLTALRRDLHRIPEISAMEFRTSAYIKEYLIKLGLKPKEIFTGIYVDIKGKNESKTIALRADIDGLSLTEKNDTAYKSTNGCMHACGHDGHTAILLVMALILTKEIPAVNVRLIYQFGEEGSGGAAQMIEKGVLEGVDEIYALHLNPALPLGQISTTGGAMFAGTVEFIIEIFGQAAHCAEPESGKDALKAAAEFICESKTANQKYKNNTLLHIGKLESGSARNIISNYSKMLATLRFFDFAAQEYIMAQISEILAKIDNEYKTNHKITVESVYSPLINSAYAVNKVKKLFPEIEECAPKFTAEDFGAYTEKVNGCMVWLGVGDEKHSSPLHSDTFDFDETALLYGIEFFSKIIF